MAVDGVGCESHGPAVVGNLLVGPRDSLVNLDFVSAHDGHRYKLAARRNVPIRVWETRRGWMELRDEFKGASLHADSAIVDCLEGIRQQLTAPDGTAVDMLRPTNASVHTGIEFAAAEPRRVSHVVPGTPASLAGILPGDEVTAVDGVDATDANVQQLMMHNLHAIGSSSAITAKRGTQVVQWEIPLTSEAAVFRCRQIDAGFQYLFHALTAGAPSADCLSLARALAEDVIKLECERAGTERVLAEAQHGQHSRIIELVNAAERKLHCSDVDALRKQVEGLRKQLVSSTDDWQVSLDREKDLEDEVCTLRDRLEHTVPNAFHMQCVDENALLRQQLHDLRLSTQNLLDPNLPRVAEDESSRLKLEVQRLHQDMKQMCEKSALENALHRTEQLTSENDRLRTVMEKMVFSSEHKVVRDENADLKTELQRLHAQLQELAPRGHLEHAQQELEAERAVGARLRKLLQEGVSKQDLEQTASLLANAIADRDKCKEDCLALSAQLEELRSRDMVPRAELLSAEGEKHAYKECVQTLELEVEQATQNLEELLAKLEDARCENRALTDARDGMVKLADLEAAQLKSDQLQRELTLLHTKVELIEKQRDTAVEERTKLTAQLDETVIRLNDMVPRSEHMEALKNLHGAKDRVEAQQNLISDFEIEISEEKSKVSAAAEEVEALKKAMVAMTPNEKLHEVELDATRLRDECVAKGKSLAIFAVENEALMKDTTTLRSEAESLKRTLTEKVPRDQLVHANKQLQEALQSLESRDKELALVSSELQESRNATLQTRKELEKFKSEHVDCVSRHELTDAISGQNAFKAELASSKSALQAQEAVLKEREAEADMLRAEKQELLAKLEASCPRAQLSAMQNAHHKTQQVPIPACVLHTHAFHSNVCVDTHTHTHSNILMFGCAPECTRLHKCVRLIVHARV